MKLKLKTHLSLIALILLGPVAGVSAAGLIDSVGSNVYGNVSGSANVSTHSASSSGSSARLSGTSSVSNEGNMGTLSAGENNAQHAILNANENSNVDEAFTLTRDSDEVTSNIGARVSATNVMNKGDLKAFAASEMRADENIQDMTFDNNHVEVSYRVPGKFLGIIPIHFNVTAIVASDGNVLLHYPWYKFLIASGEASLATSLQNEINGFITSSSTIPLTPSLEAQIAGKIRAILETALINSSGTASTTASGSNM